VVLQLRNAGIQVVTVSRAVDPESTYELTREVALGLAHLLDDDLLGVLRGDAADWLGWRLGERLLRLSLLVCFGVSAYFATLWIAGFRLRDFKRSAAE